ncbi:TetR/AcrR family transcriptional regulator [Paraburkholderia terrae]|uniref:TetR/AcrR family transcriptional regulator n=1 Tax=Paraburkholderia terrae TaxID=311230 RepID=A0A2I8F2N5_9BURK|nr:TetR/AcrR family transcriptional regulator [Paraburkholderia terrae]AUT66136.1 TetR/AcrR family transcriptional regulator [Paraburkholderia terrae]
MKKSKAETAETHKRIVAVAAKAFKEKGIAATGVAEIMSTAGLTHGAFYRHFSSKEALVAEAAALSIEVFVEAAEAAAAKGPPSFLKYLRGYLTSEVRDGVLGGCPVVQMGSELARADATTREGVSNGLRQLIDIAVKMSGDAAGASAEDDAIFTLSASIGAITMARLFDDPKFSDRIVNITKRRLLKPVAKIQDENAKTSRV